MRPKHGNANVSKGYYMGILTLEHGGWKLDIEYWVDGENRPATMVDPEERAVLMWAVERVAQAGHPDDYPNSNEIREAVAEASQL
jgi:hypothetical protein